MTFTATFLQRAAQKPGEISVEGDVETDTFRGMPVVIENRKGTIREGTDPEGNEWSITMKCDYGYIPSTEAAGDKEGLDVFIGDDPSSDYAYAVEQLKDDGSFDEYKVVLGVPDLETAEDLYLSNYEDGWGKDHVAEIWEIPLSRLFDGIKENQQKVGSLEDNHVVKEFLQSYDFEFYERIADEVHEFLAELLQTAGIRALVTSRAKRVESLRRKLEDRHAEEKIQTLGDIQEDVKDLSGVRVALYFPKDQQTVGALISSNFEQVRDPKVFPRDAEPKDGKGYTAVHYVVRWENTVVEIQVASMLMHAFSEVNHDLAYKPTQGDLSSSELNMIESLGTLVLTGETTIGQLQDAIEERTGRPLRFGVMSAWRKQIQAALYSERRASEDIEFSASKSRYQKLCDRHGVTADEMDDKLKALFREQKLLRTTGEDDVYITEACAQVAGPGSTLEDVTSPMLQRKVFQLAQYLKDEAKSI